MSAQIATGRSTWAEQVALPARLLAAAPTTLPLADVAALPLAGVTALQSLNRAAITDGDHILITGAAGAVGGIAVQLAHRGHRRRLGLTPRAPRHGRELGGGSCIQASWGPWHTRLRRRGPA
ncbi:hypothetical protein [Streptomyces sp. NPDC059651]|uniref:hypothetical protein n=1 Tax=unclassified Streptomyces TaxID=2593676 RepID=UPI0036BD4DE5